MESQIRTAQALWGHPLAPGMLLLEQFIKLYLTLLYILHFTVDCWKHALLLPDQLQLTAAPQEQEVPLVEGNAS